VINPLPPSPLSHHPPPLYSTDSALVQNSSYPAHVSVEVCTNSNCFNGSGSGGGIVPNGTGLEGLVGATNFQVLDAGGAFSRSLRGLVKCM